MIVRSNMGAAADAMEPAPSQTDRLMLLASVLVIASAVVAVNWKTLTAAGSRHA